MDKRTVDLIRVCKGHLNPSLGSLDYEVSVRLYMTECTGTNWFKYKYLASMYDMLTEVVRDYYKTFGTSTDLLYRMFDSIKSAHERACLELLPNHAPRYESFYHTIIEGICSALSLIPVRNYSGEYINGFRTEDFAEELRLSKETLDLYKQWTKG